MNYKAGYFYILTNSHHSVLYCGATDDLYRRVQEHRNKVYTNSFTARYNLDKLVYFEIFNSAAEAFEREKQVKAGSRKRKMELIENLNPRWKDLFDKLGSGSIEELIRIRKFFR